MNTKLIDEILSEENLKEAIKRVKANKGAPGVDKMSVDRLDEYFDIHKDEIINAIKNRTYRPCPVRRVYIPKANGKKRPLGIPTVIDRVIQQAIALKLSVIYEPLFSNSSYGFRVNKSAHDAIYRVLDLLNEGYEWVVDLDIEKYFDTVNHDKLVSILREVVNDSDTLHLIRLFLKAGVMEDGLVSPSNTGVPQGGPLSPVLSNIYLDKLDKELESRGLNFVRYADDVNILVKSEMSANRVMKSVTSWLERKLYLKVSATKTKVVRPTNSNFLGYTFFKTADKWKCKPMNDRMARLYDKCRQLLIRKRAVAIPTEILFIKLNQIIKGWINYFHIGKMKYKLDVFGQWLRHKVRVVILKKWKKPSRIYTNLYNMNRRFKYGFSDEDIYKVANSRLGLYARANGNVVNFILNPTILSYTNKKKGLTGLVNPLDYYLAKQFCD